MDIAKLGPLRLLRGQGRLGNDERHPLRHQAETNGTSRESRSSFDTSTRHLALRAAESAAAS
jgi:hypothetical protein